MIKSLLYILTIVVASAAISNPKFKDTETRKKIVVLDTPIADYQVNLPFMCKNGTVSSMIGKSSHLSPFEQQAVDSRFRHGENIVGLIGSRIDSSKYCIYHVAWYLPGTENIFGLEDVKVYVKALKMIDNVKNVVAVNMSLAGPNKKETYVKTEFEELNKWTESGIKVITAAGNEHLELSKDDCFTYPACLQQKVLKKENFYVVGGIKVPRSVHRPVANYSSYLKMNYEAWLDQGDPFMTGTSQATAIFTGKMFSKEGETNGK